jgi:hypothetical protein
VLSASSASLIDVLSPEIHHLLAESVSIEFNDLALSADVVRAEASAMGISEDEVPFLSGRNAIETRSALTSGDLLAS